jgi:hypothetical protein
MSPRDSGWRGNLPDRQGLKPPASSEADTKDGTSSLSKPQQEFFLKILSFGEVEEGEKIGKD